MLWRQVIAQLAESTREAELERAATDTLKFFHLSARLL